MSGIAFLVACFAVVYAYSISKRVYVAEKKLRQYEGEKARFEASGVATVQAQPLNTSHAPVSRVESNEGMGRESLPKQTSLSQDITPVKLVGTVGVLALLLGMGFFFKYAIDQGWITEVGRIAIGAIVGLLFLLLSLVWRKVRPGTAQVFGAGAVGLWYFTIFASYSFYEQISTETAFVVLIAVAVISVVLAYLHNSKFLAGLAAVGAYLIPFMVDFGPSQFKVAFIYLTLVNAAVMAVFVKKYRVELPAVAIFFNAIHFVGWFMSAVSHRDAVQGLTFVLVNFMVFMLVTAIAFREKVEEKQGDMELISKNTAGVFGIFIILSYIALVATSVTYGYVKELPLILVLASLLIFVSYVLIDRLEEKYVNWMLIWLGKAFLVSAIFWQFEGPIQAVYLALLALAGVVVGLATKREEIRASSATLVTLSMAIGLVLSFTTSGPREFMGNSEFWAVALVVLVACLFAASYTRFRLELSESEQSVKHFMPMLALAGIWLQVSIEISRYLPGLSENGTNLLISLWWMGLGVVAGLVGLWSKLRVLRTGGAVLIAAAVGKVFLYDVSALEMGYRVVSFIVLGVILLALAFAFERNKEKMKGYFVLEESEKPGEMV